MDVKELALLKEYRVAGSTTPGIRKQVEKRRKKRRWRRGRKRGATDLSGKLGDIWRLELSDGQMASRQGVLALLVKQLLKS